MNLRQRTILFLVSLAAVILFAMLVGCATPPRVRYAPEPVLPEPQTSNLKTPGAAVAPPPVTLVPLWTPEGFELQFAAVVGAQYELFGTTDLTSWRPIGVLLATTDPVVAVFVNPRENFRAFRVRSMPFPEVAE